MTSTATAERSAADDKSRIQSIGKMMDVLSCFSPVERRLTLAQLALASGLPRPTAHRMLAALKEIGFIEQDIRSGGYALGLRLFQLGSLALANMDLMREAKPFVDRLSRLAGESAHLGVFNGFEITVIGHEEPLDRPAVRVQPSEAAPAYCTGVGKAVLAFQTPAVIDRVLAAGLKPFTSNTIVDVKRLRKELAHVRERGYAIDDAEHQIWVRCVAAPIRNSAGQVIAAISVTGPADRMTQARTEQLAPLVTQTADTISMQLGHTGG